MEAKEESQDLAVLINKSMETPIVKVK